MLEQDIPAIYIKLEEVEGSLKIVPSEIPMHEVFNCGNRSLQDLSFDFESIFEPYQQFSFDPIDGIDLVIKDTDGNFLAPLEVKLTVLPTSATSAKPESQWRKYVTTDRIMNLALNKDVVHEIIEPGYIERLMPERRFDQTLYFTVRVND